MSVTYDQLQEAIARMREARQRILAREVDSIIYSLARAAADWLPADSPWRRQAVEHAPATTRFSPEMIHEAITLTFSTITNESLGAMLDRELGTRYVLDKFCTIGNTQTRAHGPNFITHVLAGNIPMPGIVSICCGLLLRSANLVKTSHLDPIFPDLFVQSLREVDPHLADCVAVLNWGREENALTKAALAPADAVIVYGDDKTVATMKAESPPSATFLGYGHKISFALVTKDAMTTANLPALAEAAAHDVSVYDQQGCLSPHLFYVEERGELSPRKFAAALAQAMAAYQARIPRGSLSPEESVTISRVRDAYEYRASRDRRAAVWRSVETNDWAVIYEDDPSFMPSCLNRLVFVKPTDGFPRVLSSIERIAEQISTVGIAPMNDRSTALASDLATMGIHRVCPVGQMQKPALALRHDGRPHLAELVRWTDAG